MKRIINTFNALILSTCLLLCISCSKNSDKYIGTWVHTYDGSDSNAYVNDDDDLAENELVLYKDGTFTYTWVDRYYTTQGRWINNYFVRRVSKWGSGEGDWNIRDGKLFLKYTTGKEDEYSIEIDKNARSLKMGDFAFIKKLH